MSSSSIPRSYELTHRSGFGTLPDCGRRASVMATRYLCALAQQCVFLPGCPPMGACKASHRVLYAHHTYCHMQPFTFAYTCRFGSWVRFQQASRWRLVCAFLFHKHEGALAARNAGIRAIAGLSEHIKSANTCQTAQRHPCSLLTRAI